MHLLNPRTEFSNEGSRVFADARANQRVYRDDERVEPDPIGLARCGRRPSDDVEEKGHWAVPRRQR